MASSQTPRPRRRLTRRAVGVRRGRRGLVGGRRSVCHWGHGQRTCAQSGRGYPAQDGISTSVLRRSRYARSASTASGPGPQASTARSLAVVRDRGDRFTPCPHRPCRRPQEEGARATHSRRQETPLRVLDRARLRAASDAGARRRRTPGLGVGSELARCRARRRLLLPVRVRHHRRVPPLLHPPRVQGQPRPAQRPGDRREPRPAGRRPHLGRRSPPPPRLHRQGG